MLVDRVLRATFRNFATLFLATAIVTVPVQVGYELAFDEVVAVGHLHHFIDEFPEGRQVRGVGAAELERYRWWGIAIVLLEIALLPVLVRVTRRVLATDGDDEIPGVALAWARALRRLPSAPRPPSWPVPVVVGLVVAVGVFLLGESIAAVAAEPVPRAYVWAVLAAARGAVRALAAPFLLVPLAVAAGGFPRPGEGTHH